MITFAKKPIIIGTVSVLLATCGVATYAWYEGQRPSILEVYVIPLKSGQALFIRTPKDKRILIDGGSSSEIVRSISHILPFYSRHIDTVMITKPDAAHVTGLIDVINRYDVGEVLIPEVTLPSLNLATSTDQIYAVLLDTIAKHKIPLKKVIADKIDDDSINSLLVDSILFQFIFPTSAENFKYSKASGPELAFVISNGIKSVMNIGSITPKIQKFIASSSNAESADILIISKNPTAANLAQKFLDKFMPKSIIYSKAIKKGDLASVGNSNISNNYNIRETGIIKIAIDGQQINIEKISN